MVGLGNPGKAYADTRHNVGFRVLDRLAKLEGLRFRIAPELKRTAWVAEVERADGSLIVLAKPRTYMNRSGRALSALCRRYETAVDDIVTVYDDADLAFGRIRIRPEGGAGGHNGIRSMMDVLGSGAFARVRLGIRGEGRDEQNLADYVLTPFTKAEQPAVEALVELGADAVRAIETDGVAEAMNRFNGRTVAPSEQAEEE